MAIPPDTEIIDLSLETPPAYKTTRINFDSRRIDKERVANKTQTVILSSSNDDDDRLHHEIDEDEDAFPDARRAKRVKATRPDPDGLSLRTATLLAELDGRAAARKDTRSAVGKRAAEKSAGLAGDGALFRVPPGSGVEPTERSTSQRRNDRIAASTADRMRSGHGSREASLGRHPPPELSERTAALLAGLSTGHAKRQRKTSTATRVRGSDSQIENDTSDEAGGVEGSSTRLAAKVRTVKKKPATSTTAAQRREQAEVKAAQRERDTTARTQAKAAEKERKDRLKEEKAREKQAAADLTAANKSRTDKKVSTPEMIVDLPSTIIGHDEAPMAEKIGRFLKNLGVQIASYDAPVSNVIKWRRKVTAVYDEEQGHWEPVAEHVRQEKHALCLMPAAELVALATRDPNEADGHDLDAHVVKMQSQFLDCKIIYLIEGLAAWMRKNKNIRNRAYQAEVMNGVDRPANEDEDDPAGRRRAKRTKARPVYVDEDMIEDALLRVQVVHKCLIHHTATPDESAEWVSVFTQHISTIPYRTQRVLSQQQSSFCMDVGQVKPGLDASDTYVKMLQEIVRVTAPIAYGIAAEHPHLRSLVHAFDEMGPGALQDLKKTANKTGAFTTANIGPAISKRIYKIFNGLDPDSHDV
ncbi:MAG: hypothetical protein M1826_005283 [Phylliscum demangeonii]|nr:MAG: hypothetical protein M1826_005283 [Phylliscum demangeonii]